MTGQGRWKFDVRLGRFQDDRIRAFLTENEFEPNFGPVHQIYYRLIRPVAPIRARQWLQARKQRSVRFRKDFIWDDLVRLVRSDAHAWNDFIADLYPTPYESAIVLTHDVETQAGYDFIPEVVALEQRYGFKSSWNLVAKKYELRRSVLELLHESGNEVGIHGYNHDGTLYFTEARFNRRARYINEALVGHGAVGFRSPQVHRNLRWLQRLRVEYDASCFDYDPFQPLPGGTGCIWPYFAGRFVELPYTVPQDHVVFYLLGQRKIDIWKAKTEWLVENKGMVLVLTHPDYLMERDHLRLYADYLHFLSQIQAWRCLPVEMVRRYESKFRLTP